MTWLSKTLTAVLLAVFFTAAVKGVNQCITDVCVAGTTSLKLENCGLVDADLDDIASCLDTLGRDTIDALYLAKNELTSIPSDFFTGMSILHQLELDDNDITSLDAATFQPFASTMYILFLHGNQLTTLPSGLFAGMGALQFMYMMDNPLATLGAGLFDDLTSLRTLLMYNLQLPSLPSGLFASTGNMLYLSMKNSMLSALDADTFDAMSVVDIVDLRDNDLTTLPEGVFETMGPDTLRFVLLAGNDDLQCIPTSSATGERTSFSYSSTNTFSVEVPNDGMCECTGVATCDGDCTAGADGYICDAGAVCADDSDCDTTAGEICCETKLVCEVVTTETVGGCGDPHMTGFLGQKFDFTGEDGKWYAVVSDLPYMHLNMRVTAPVPSLPEITYITGISIITIDADGLDHTIIIAVAEPHSMESACPVGMSACLADGALHVVADGEEIMLTPDEVTLAPGVAIAAVNLPGECRSFGFEQYWERKKLQLAQPGRRLRDINVMQDMSDWVLADPTATNMVECEDYVATAVDGAGLFEHQSEHASFQIMTPTATIRLSHGRLHQLPVRDPTDKYDLPDHLAWQMNLAIDHSDMSLDATGILGETSVPTLDHNGAAIMQGMEAIRGVQEDYRVSGPLEVFFSQDQHHE